MFEIEREERAIDRLELFLARVTGRANWPFALATCKSTLAIDAGLPTEHSFISDRTARFLIVTYEIAGKPYTSPLHMTLEHIKRHTESTSSISIQYDPLNPKRIYFAPACRLANHLIAATAIITAVVLLAVLSI